MLATAHDVLIAWPLAFLVGLGVGLWVGGRFLIIRKRSDGNGNT